MMSHYTYSPYSEKPVLSSVMMLLAIGRYWEEFARLMEHMAMSAEVFDVQSMQTMMQYGEILIREMRIAPRSYYEFWIFHHMLRVAILHGLGYDIKDSWDYLNEDL